MGINATLLVQMVTFAVFVWFTMKFIWPPLSRAMDNREKRIADGLAAAEKGSRALQEAASKSEEQLRDTRTQAQEILTNANKQAARILDEARAQARTDADRIKVAARDEVERELAKAREALRRQVADLAVLGAARILKREIDAAKHAEVLEDLAARV